MKKIRYILTASILLLLLSGCEHFLQPPVTASPDKGKGFVKLQFAADSGRTVLPSSLAFQYWRIIFTPNPSGTSLDINNNTSGNNNLSQLQAAEGTYRMEVRIFSDAARTTQIAGASNIAVTVARLTPATVNVPLEFTVMNGNGTFAWNITGVGTPDVRNITLTRLDAAGSVSKSAMSGTDASVPSGYYWVNVHLEKDLIASNSGAKHIAWDDIIHIYNGQTTNLNLAFTESDYSNNIENMWLVIGTTAYQMTENGLGYFSIQRNITAGSTFAFSLSNPSTVTTATQRAWFVPSSSKNVAQGKETAAFVRYNSGSGTASNRWTLPASLGTGLYNLTVSPVTNEFWFNKAGSITIRGSGAWYETLYVEWEKMDNVPKFNVYYKATSSSTWIKIDDPLVREYKDCYRADVLGISAGNYDVKVVQVNDAGVEGSDASVTVNNVIAHQRIGFAFVNTTPGAYNSNGTPKTGARIVYVTDTNKDTIKLAVRTADAKEETFTGLQSILTAYEKGYEIRPTIFRFIGKINQKRGSAFVDGEGSVMLKGNSSASRPVNVSGMNVTFEGVGNDATAYGWGFRTSAANSVEIRNIGIMLSNTDQKDAIEMQNSKNMWVHNVDFFYGMPGSASDQKKGDGTLDIKNCDFVTNSFNHFWDSGKSSLLGNSASETPGRITYHHNWFDHSDSRHPLVRVHKVHMLNNLYEGVGKYGMIARVGANIFADRNYFLNTKKPILTSQQGTDIANGTANAISSDNGGVIKAFGNVIDGTSDSIVLWSSSNTEEYDAYPVNNQNDTVPSTITAKKGGASYDNSFLSYSYTGDTANTAMVTKIKTYAGRYYNGGDFKHTFPAGANTHTDDPMPDLLLKLQNYTTNLVAVQDIGAGGDDPGPPLVCGVCGLYPCGCGGDPALTGTVTISGTAQEGQTLTASASLSGSGTITYQWRRGNTNTGSNSATYVVQTADIGSTITVTVTRAGSSGSITSNQTAAVTAKPAGVNPAAVTGTILISSDFSAISVNDTLYKGVLFGSGWTAPMAQTVTVSGINFTHRTANGGKASNTQRYIGIPVSGPTTITLYLCSNGSSSNTLGINHTTNIGDARTAVVTGYEVIGGGSNTSAPGEIVYNTTAAGYHIVWVWTNNAVRLFGISVGSGGGTPSDPALTGTVTISGTAAVGSTLTASTSGLNGSGTITYQWKRGTANIGTSSTTYTVQSADAGNAITVVVTRAGTTGSLTSNAINIPSGGGDPIPGLGVWNQATIGTKTTSSYVKQANIGSVAMTARATTQQGWTTSAGQENGNYIYTYITGDFELTVKVSGMSFSANDNNDRIGIMAMHTNPAALNITSPNISDYVGVTIGGGALDPRCLNRDNGGSPSYNQLSSSGRVTFASNQAGGYIRLKREGTTYTSTASLDGTTWGTSNRTVNMTGINSDNGIYIGLLVSGRAITADSTAAFSDLTLKYGTNLSQTYTGDFSSLSN